MLTSLEELADLDLALLRQGKSVGLTSTAEPLFCVCTHGRHDACCAELGRPVAAALAKVDSSSVWEVSHIGGDRFAANVVVLPHGLYYGRVEVDRASQVVRRHLDGHLTTDLFRGRSAYPLVVQAGEHYLRRELGETRIDALRLIGRSRLETPSDAGETWQVTFAAGPGVWIVRLRATDASPSLLTCRARTPSPPPAFTLLGIGAG